MDLPKLIEAAREVGVKKGGGMGGGVVRHYVMSKPSNERKAADRSDVMIY